MGKGLKNCLLCKHAGGCQLSSSIVTQMIIWHPGIASIPKMGVAQVIREIEASMSETSSAVGEFFILMSVLAELCPFWEIRRQGRVSLTMPGTVSRN